MKSSVIIFTLATIATLATTISALPANRRTSTSPLPPTQPPPENTTWIWAGCIPSSVNSNAQCAQNAPLWSGAINVVGCDEYTMGFYCANYLSESIGYYPTRFNENVLQSFAFWNYTGCVSNSVPPSQYCKGPFMYDRNPQGSRSCPSWDEYPLWCATGGYDY